MAELPSGTVTFLFTDLEGSTRLWEQYPQPRTHSWARHGAILSDAIAECGGHIVKMTGAGVHAAFSDAASALHAALDAQQAFSEHTWDDIDPLRVRMGIHTGHADARDGDYFGAAVNRAARLMSVAHGGQIVVSLATEELLRDSDVNLIDLGEHALRDLSRPEHVFQVANPGLEREFPPLASLDAFGGNLPVQVTSFVGRDDELARVVGALGRERVV